MPAFHFHSNIPVRYGDLDPQGHLNNAHFFTFIEQARVDYLVHLGLWTGQDFLELGLIVADAHIAYLNQVNLGQTVRIGTRVSRIGNKSLGFEYELTDLETGQILARGDTAMVAYDYRTRQTIRVPDEWREKIEKHEQKDKG